jgi:putative membrane protein
MAQPELLPNEGEKLHALSWLFVLIAQLLNLLGPILLVLVAGRMSKDDGWQTLIALIAAAALSAYSLFYTRTFRFWIASDELIVKEGLFNRTLRHVPFSRIQNVAFRQTLLHRVFAVVELNLESGAGAKPEAKMTVLPLARAKLLEKQIRGMVKQAADDANDAPTLVGSEIAASSEVLLHQVHTPDLLRLGLISNRGMVVMGTAFYFLNQSNLLPHNFFKNIAHWVRTTVGVGHGPVYWTISGILWFAMVLIVVRMASMVLAIFSFHDFRLYAAQDRLRVEHGLTTRQGGTTRIGRIVCVLLRDGMLYRWFKRQSVEVILPGNGEIEGGNQRVVGMRYLSPVAAADVAQKLIAIASGISVNTITLQPLHPRAWRRMVKWPLLIIGLQVLGLIVFLALHGYFYAGLALSFAYSVFAVWLVRGYQRSAAASGYALTPTHCIIRTGYFSQCTHIVPRREVQSVYLSQSPFDRRSHMANVAIDLSAGSPMHTPPAVVHYLPEKIALELAANLRCTLRG